VPAIRDLAEDRLQMAAPLQLGRERWFARWFASAASESVAHARGDCAGSAALAVGIAQLLGWAQVVLANHGGPQLPPSTVKNILRRGGLIDPARSAAATPWQRFERGGPNELWQMDWVTLP
jgi:hypothetical protein